MLLNVGYLHGRKSWGWEVCWGVAFLWKLLSSPPGPLYHRPQGTAPPGQRKAGHGASAASPGWEHWLVLRAGRAVPGTALKACSHQQHWEQHQLAGVVEENQRWMSLVAQRPPYRGTFVWGEEFTLYSHRRKKGVSEGRDLQSFCWSGWARAQTWHTPEPDLLREAELCQASCCWGPAHQARHPDGQKKGFVFRQWLRLFLRRRRSPVCSGCFQHIQSSWGRHSRFGAGLCFGSSPARLGPWHRSTRVCQATSCKPLAGSIAVTSTAVSWGRAPSRGLLSLLRRGLVRNQLSVPVKEAIQGRGKWMILRIKTGDAGNTDSLSSGTILASASGMFCT